jgi:hypothetical protein
MSGRGNVNSVERKPTSLLVAIGEVADDNPCRLRYLQWILHRNVPHYRHAGAKPARRLPPAADSSLGAPRRRRRIALPRRRAPWRA